MYDLLIQNCTIVSPDSEIPRILPEHDIAVQDQRIAVVQPAGQISADQATEVIDSAEMVALPGLINAHAHAAMVLFRGAAEDVPVEAWFNDFIWPMETNLTPEDVYWGAMLAAVEMIESGITTVADHYFAMDSVAEAIVQSGMRGHLAPTMFGQGDPRAELDMAVAFAARWHGAARGRIQSWLGPHSPYLCPPEFLRTVAAEARALGLGCHIHVSETAQQVQASVERHGVTPIRLLEQLGLLDAPLLCAHAAHATPEEIGLLADHRVGVAHCPKTFLKLAAGIAPVVAMRARGVAVGVGSDGAASNNTLDMLEQLRLAAMLQKHELGDARALPAGAALALATSVGARALGQGDALGVLAPGALADIILVRIDGAHVQPVHNLAAALVYATRASDIDTTIVDGRVLMRGRRLQTLDKAMIMREVNARVTRLQARQHGRRLQTYQP
jgi:5-methylthioadenosine/S-adenosylhomocysteine deaminase